MHVITEEPFIVKPNNDAKELVWVHDVGYSYRLPDGSLVPTCKSISEMIEREAPAPDGCPEQGARVIPVRGLHDKLPVLGFRFGDIAYITDMSSLEESELEKLKGLRHLTLNTVSYKKHHSHFSLEEALVLADRIGAEHTWLTHLSHTFPNHHEFAKYLGKECKARGLRSDVQPAYDGLVIE